MREDFRGLADDRGLGATDVSEQSFGGERGADAFDEIDDRETHPLGLLDTVTVFVCDHEEQLERLVLKELHEEIVG